MDGTSGGDEFAVQWLLSIKTAFRDKFEGQIRTCDRPSNILVLQEGLKQNRKTEKTKPKKMNRHKNQRRGLLKVRIWFCIN